MQIYVNTTIIRAVTTSDLFCKNYETDFGFSGGTRSGKSKQITGACQG